MNLCSRLPCLAPCSDGAKISEMRNAIIEDERKRMLAAAAKHLGIEHLPKGVLRTEDDAALFRSI